MAIVYDKLMALKIPDSAQTYTERDAIFYALSLGLGRTRSTRTSCASSTRRT